MAKLKIGDAVSFRAPESWDYKPDDRQERIEIINGVVIQDYGWIGEGDIISCTAIFKITEYYTILGYWQNRTKVRIIDESGAAFDNMRVIIKSVKYVAKHPDYVTVTMEFWKC